MPDPSSDGSKPGTVAVVVGELTKVVEPVVENAEDPESLVQFVQNVGLDEEELGDGLDTMLDSIAELAGAYETLRTEVVEPLLNGEPPSTGTDVFEALKQVFETFQTLNSLSIDLDDVDGSAVGDLLFDYLVVEYLYTYHPQVHDGLVLGGVITGDYHAETRKVTLANVTDSFANPNEAFVTTTGWGEEFAVDVFLRFLGYLTESWGFTSTTVARKQTELASLDYGTEPYFPSAPMEFDSRNFTLFQHYDHQSKTESEIDLDLVSVLASQGGPVGLLALLSANAEFSEDFDLGGGWRFSATVGAQGTFGVSALPGPSGTAFDVVSDQGVPGSVEGKLGVNYDGSKKEGEPDPLLGDPAGSHLSVRRPGVNAKFGAGNGSMNLGIESQIPGTLVINPQGGFVSKVLPNELAVDFDPLVGYSIAEGVYFQGGASLEATISLDLTLGPVTIDEVYLAAKLAAGESIPLEVAASATAQIGPVAATVKQMGVGAAVSFPENKDGNLGAVNLELGFKPPAGVGVSVDAGPVSGGGYIEHEPDKHRYAGVLQLQIGEYTIKAVGLLKTRLPSGEDGYSFLLLITAELPPIQLGFGFTLNGIGGLLGINRSFRADPLGKAVRTGNMNSVLFPENVVANANRIISDLRSIFPPKADRYVVGPMAKFGWGSPTLLTMDVGIILEIPTWKIALLGKFMLQLPDEKAPLVDLKLAILGVLDIPNKRVSIDASLYDSRIVQWSVKGDMALRSSWGDDANFMLSIGGFHPRYDPPKTFPELDRVKVWIPTPGGNPRIEFTGYLAVTPNTFQVGAGVVVDAEAGPAKLHGELSFDALFRFNPFEFVVDFYAKFAASLWGHGLSISIDGTISGPKPLGISGKVTIDLPLLPEVSASVDVSIGSAQGDKPLPTSKVFDQLVTEVEKPQNWQAQLPAGGSQFVTIRQPKSEKDRNGQGEASGSSNTKQVLAHPLGGIAVRQTVVPLKYRIEKFGSARPAGFDKFTVTSMAVVREDGENDEIGPGPDLRESFAPAKYREMSDQEKLSKSAFVDRPAGHESSGEQFHQPDPEDCRTASLAYETVVTDEERTRLQHSLAAIGRYRRAATATLPAGPGHPAEARIGVPIDVASNYLPLTSVGRAQPTQGSFLRTPRMRVGLPDVDESGEKQGTGGDGDGGESEDGSTLGVTNLEVLR